MTRKREGQRNGGWEKRNNRRRNRESIDLLGRNVKKILTESCLAAYEW